MGLKPKGHLVLGCNDGWEEGGCGLALLRGRAYVVSHRIVNREGPERWFVPYLFCRLELFPETA